MIRLHGRPLSPNSIHDILRNEKYSGVFVYSRGTHKEHRHTRDNAIRVPDALPAIVPRDMWERVQARMDGRKVNPGERASQKAKREFLLAGLIICGQCGAALVGNNVGGRTEKKRYAYYECNKRGRTKECDLKTIRADLVEQMVIDEIRLTYFTPEGKANILARFEAYLAARPNLMKQETMQLKKDIGALDRKINNILLAIEEGRSTAAVMDRLALYEQQRAELNMQTLSIMDTKKNTSISIEQVADYLEEAEEQFRTCDDPKKLKHLIQLFTESVIVDNEGVEINIILKTPPGFSGDVLDTTGSANETRTRVSALRVPEIIFQPILANLKMP